MMSKQIAKPKHTAPVFVHPTAAHNPQSLSRVEKNTNRRAMLIDGVVVLVDAKAQKK